MLLVTGASDNHFLTLINMIRSFIHHNETHHLIVYNLGLSADKWHQMLQLNHPFVSFKVFDYSKYPEWFNIHIEAGQYAWKPTIIYDTFLEHPDEKIVWMDAGNLIHSQLKELEAFLDKKDVYSATSDGNIEKWTFPATIQYMNCTWKDRENRNAACIGFNCKTDKVKAFIKEFHDYAQIKECIAPDGSSRQNHRQDQAVFSILFYKYGFDGNQSTHLGYSIHNDIDH